MYSRRKFISFVGKAGLGLAIVPPFLIRCGNTTNPSSDLVNTPKEVLDRLKNLTLEALEASDKDDLLLTANTTAP